MPASLMPPTTAPGPATPGAVLVVYARRKFYELADIAGSTRSCGSGAISPIGVKAVTRIDAIFDRERTINGNAAKARLTIRRERLTDKAVEEKRHPRQ